MFCTLAQTGQRGNDVDDGPPHRPVRQKAHNHKE
jgi:hypothetical protein